MPSPAGPFHVAQEAALRAHAGLIAVLNPFKLYTTTPKNATPDYVVIGEDQVFYETSGCAGEGEIFATVQVWTRPNPPQGADARTIGAEIIAALNTELSLTGHDVDVWELESETYVTDPDHSTHGRFVFHYLTTEQVA